MFPHHDRHLIVVVCLSQPKSPRWRNIDSLPLVEPLVKGGLKRSYKADQHVFEIFLSYQGMEVSRTVNENLHLRILFTLAKSYLETDFHFLLRGDHELDLTFAGRSLPRSGVLSDIPLYEDSVVVVLYSLKPPMYGERLSLPTTNDGGHQSPCRATRETKRKNSKNVRSEFTSIRFS